MAELLGSLKMDYVFHRAVGDLMYYYDENEKEVEIIDFLGGFGASLFGHNHPDLVKVARSFLDNSIPFNAQMSCRGNAALLAEKLNGFMFKSTGKNYITTFASTGTEAVEAAIKHAELSHYKRIDNIIAEVEKCTIILGEKFYKKKINVPSKFTEALQANGNIFWDGNIDKALSWIRNNCYQTFRKEPAFFISLNHSFHGKTSGSLQLTHNEKYRKPFNRLGIKVRFLDPYDLDELGRIINEATIIYTIAEIDKGN